MNGLALISLIMTEEAVEANVEVRNYARSPLNPHFWRILKRKVYSNLSKAFTISTLRS